MSDANYQIIKKDQMIDYLVECMVPDGKTKITATVSIEKEPEARPEIIYLSKMLGKNNEGSDKIKELEAIVGKLKATVTSIQRDRGLLFFGSNLEETVLKVEINLEETEQHP